MLKRFASIGSDSPFRVANNAQQFSFAIETTRAADELPARRGRPDGAGEPCTAVRNVNLAAFAESTPTRLRAAPVRTTIKKGGEETLKVGEDW